MILRRAVAQGVKWGRLGVNPAAAATPPKVPKPDIKPPSAEQLGRVLQRAFDEQPELACYLIVAAATGARRSEVVALRWSDIDLEQRTVSIQRRVVMGMGGAGRKGHQDPLVAPGVVRRSHSLGAGCPPGPDAPSRRGLSRRGPCQLVRVQQRRRLLRVVVPDTVSRSFKRLCRLEGMPDVRLHDLRHFVATQLFGAGVDARTIAGRLGRLGHRNAATTLNVYAHFLESVDRDAADIMGGVIEFPDREAS